MNFELWHLHEPEGQAVNWVQILKPNSLHVVFNQGGEGLVMASETRLTLLPRTTALFATHQGSALTTATRFKTEEAHQFIILIVPSSEAESIFGQVGPFLKRSLGIIRRWTEREKVFYEEFLTPPVPSEAQKAWFLAKTLEILSLYLFHEPKLETPLFCSIVKGNASRYVREALELMQGRLGESLDLRALAQDVGCAPHYLSRLVKQSTGKTLSLHLRAFRIERAAELLAGNRFNVTEVALEVGYNSLSHFSKAFAQEKEMTPSQFLKRQQK